MKNGKIEISIQRCEIKSGLFELIKMLNGPGQAAIDKSVEESRIEEVTNKEIDYKEMIAHLEKRL